MVKDPDWHLDKRVSIVALSGLVFHTLALVVGGTWFLAEFKATVQSQDVRITAVEVEVADLSDDVQSIETQAGLRAVQLGRIEENIESIKENIDRLVDALDRSSR